MLVPFPSTNQAALKKRPAVIVSFVEYNRTGPDVIVMAITSQLRQIPALGEVWIAGWQEAGLLNSAVEPVFATLEHLLVIRRLGSLLAEDQASLSTAIGEVIG